MVVVELVLSAQTSAEVLSFAGPLPNTVIDFWWLVWQEQVHVVAMVTNIVERGQQKCEQYWPDEGTKEYEVLCKSSILYIVSFIFTLLVQELHR